MVEQEVVFGVGGGGGGGGETGRVPPGPSEGSAESRDRTPRSLKWSGRRTSPSTCPGPVTDQEKNER